MRRTFPLLLLLAAPLALAQRDFSKVEVKASHVAGNVHVLVGAGGNIGVSVGDDGIVMIDDQYAPLAPKIEVALRLLTPKPVRFILNTHFHGDHTGGNESFGKSAPIVAHDNVRRRLASGGSRGGQTIPPATPGALPVLTFNDSVTIHLNGEDIRAVHMPHAHTDGDAVIWFTKSNVVHMGDTYFNGAFPFVDRESGGSVRGLIENIDKVLATIPDDAKIIPGHGAVSDKNALRSYAATLKGSAAAVETGIAAGKTADLLKAENILAPWESWGKGFIKSNDWIQTVYDELTGK